MATWLTAWADAEQTTAADRDACLSGLEVLGSERDDLTRRWLVVDWLVRAATPRWLRAIGLRDDAAMLHRLPPLGSPEALTRAAPTVDLAAQTARDVHSRTWDILATQIDADLDDPARSHIWQAVVDGARQAAGAIRTVLEPAARTTGYPADPERGPASWRPAVATVTDAAAALCWQAITDITTWSSWSWRLPPETGRAVAYSAARSALAPAEAATRGAACELLTVMFTISRSREEPR